MTNDLTYKQQEALNAIKTYISTKGVSPTLQDLKSPLRVNSNQAVINYLDRLEEKGYIKRDKGARGIRILNPNAYTNPFLKALEEGAQKRQVQQTRPTSGPLQNEPTSRFMQGSIDNATTESPKENNSSKYISFSINL